MITNSIFVLFLTILVIALINLFIRRDRTYVVFLKDVQTNANFTLVVKSLSKRKAYEVVSKYLMNKGLPLPLIITDVTNTIVVDNNKVICSNIYINKK